MTSRRRATFGLSLLAALACCLPASAQTQITTGVIQGTVLDPQGAVVADAAVEAKNLGTNLTRAAHTDAGGRFVFLQLPPGRYSVSVKKPGFATLVQDNVPLSVGQLVSLDLTMKVSSVDETVTVTGTSIVDDSKTEVSSR